MTRSASKCVSSDCAVRNALEGASRSLKTETRASGSSFVILGGSVKLDAVILISHKSLFGYALCNDL